MHLVLYTRASCSHCTRAKALLVRRGLAFDERSLDRQGRGPGPSERALAARLEQLFGRVAMPFVLLDGEPLGGLAELEELERRGGLG